MPDGGAATRRGGLYTDGGLSRDQAPLSQLLRELAADGRRLVRDEIGLAKMELRQSARTFAADGAIVGAGAFVGALGVVCLTAGLVIGLGLLVGSYWASALIIGALLLVAGLLMVVKGLEAVRSTSIKPERTIETLKEDAEWVGDEVRSMRREWSAGAG